ncbi:choice-of-anchor X domain-containing protein [Massilia sp. PWRC2]|uniref:choice-of-anchor X domain-containing protein n=1 Tax=Massilia sp. PWRC2 TaxID=2804626 RepID=UPI003CFB47C1
MALHLVVHLRWRRLVAGLALLAVLAWLIVAESTGGSGQQARLTARAAPLRSAAAPALPAALPTAALLDRRSALLAQVQLSAATYCHYRDSSKYPFNSRPISEQPDQVYPNAAINQLNPMRLQGGTSDPRVLIQTAQTRVFLAAGETVSFSVRAVDGNGVVLPLVVLGATAEALTSGKQRPLAPISLPFADDGSGADPVAGDGAYAATLVPVNSALAGFHGTIRTRVRYSVGGEAGSVEFDVIYSPELPAVWSGPPREVVADGALSFYLPLQVHQRGRYVVSGRVDDASGAPLALLSFNEVLPSGPNEVKLTVFGKLLRDQQAALPLTLRDVDAYLLRENSDPDRALMARREGAVLTGKVYPLSRFADSEWHSEERSRHLTEFAGDAKAARAALARLAGAAAVPEPPCALPP